MQRLEVRTAMATTTGGSINENEEPHETTWTPPKCIWNIVHFSQLVIVIANFGSVPNKRTDFKKLIEIIDLNAQESV